MFDKIYIGNIEFRNRVMFPPLTTGYEEKDGSISKRCIDFYQRLAKGGVGYIVLGDVAPARTISPTPKLFADYQIESFKKLTDAVHAEGAKIGAQIFHPEYNPEVIAKMFQEGNIPALRKQIHHDMEHYCNDITIERMVEIQQIMVDCAIRADKAGFDVIHIHGDRLLGMFCSPLMNKRTDTYGGSLENRARFTLELIKKLKTALPHQTFEYKLSMIRQDPPMGKGGPTIEEGKQIAKWLEEAGIHTIHACQANHTEISDTLPAMGIQPYGCFVDMAQAIKSVVNIPVSAVGRIITPQFANQILSTNKADMVAIGRQLLADPDWVIKAQKGRDNDIRYCIMCNKGCTDKITGRSVVGCVINAENGNEATRSITKTTSAKQVTIVGGGVAGLEAARVAAKKGHNVILFEKETFLGGQVNVAKMPPRKIEMERVVNYLSHAVCHLGVILHMGKLATPEDVLATKPDIVIVATGSKNHIIPFKGVELPHVLDAWSVLTHSQQCYGKVAIIGGGLVGAETAEFLAEQGMEVSIIEMQDEIAKEESSSIRPTMFRNFNKYQVALLPKHKVLEIKEQSVVCETPEGTREIACDFVVMAVGAKSVGFDSTLLAERNIPVKVIGDANTVSDIEKAIANAYDVANDIG